jgi:endonuclease YncB( thermonuclease family)
VSEVSEPDCAYEAELGADATRRLTQLLNADPFTLKPIDRATDKYGRKLYVITRAGESLGGQLVSEGLAEEWQGYRRDWCG